MIRSALALATALIFVQEAKPSRNSWAGFPDGSWVVVETRETADTETATKRHRSKVENQPGGKVVCHVSEEKDTPAIFFEERTIESGVGVEEVASKSGKPKAGSIDIDGKKIACDINTYADKEMNATGKQATTVWTSKELKVPYRDWNDGELQVAPGRITHSIGFSGLALDSNILQYSMSHHAGDGSGRMELHRFRIVELDHKLKVAGREIACVVEEGTIEEKDPKGATKVTFKRWLSDAVPGRVVRSEMRGDVRGVKVERIRHVVDFAVK